MGMNVQRYTQPNNGGKYLGSCRLHDTFSFVFDPMNDVPFGLGEKWWGTDWDQDTSNPAIMDESKWRYHVIDNATTVTVLEEQFFTAPTGHWWGMMFGSIETTGTEFNPGQYTLKIGPRREDRQTDAYDSFDHITFSFDVDHPAPDQPASLTYRRLNYLHDNTEWILNDIENVVFPRLKRLLGFEGENLLLDLFAYDNAGNITSMRARIFDSAEACQNSTPDIDSTDTPEPGELWTYTITQNHNLPRNVRTEHKSVLDYDGDPADITDAAVTDSYRTFSDSVDAPGNTDPRNSTWPTV